LKIRSIETFSNEKLCIVRIRSDDGFEGYGQTAPYHANISALVLHQQLSPHVLGKEVNDPQDIAALAETCIVREHKFPGSYLCRAVAGIETALWDLLGKREGLGVCELLGGKPRAVEVYGSSMRRDIAPEQEAERLARLKQTSGFRAFKIRIGNNFGYNEDVWPGRTEQIVPAVRRAIGDETLLYADANSGFTPERAIEVGRMLEQYGVCHYEEPCPYPELEWTKQVADALEIPVAGGEQDTDLAHWKRMIAMHAVDIVQPDICYIGGLSRALKVANMANEHGMTCTPHAANLSLVTVFTLHMMAVIPNAGRFMEFTIENDAWTRDLYAKPLEVREGRVMVPEGPGWGVDINTGWLHQAEYRISQ